MMTDADSSPVAPLPLGLPPHPHPAPMPAFQPSLKHEQLAYSGIVDSYLHRAASSQVCYLKHVMKIVIMQVAICGTFMYRDSCCR